MSASPELLFVTPVVPAVGGNGLAMRAGLFLEGLARCGRVRVLVVPVFGGTPAAGDLVRRHAAGFEVLALEPARDPGRAAIARLSTPERRRRTEALHPLPSLSRAAPALAEAVAEAAAGCDAVHVMRLYLAPFLDALLDAAPRPRTVLDLDDVDSALARSLGDPAEAEAYERLEAHLLPRFDHVVTCSTADADLVSAREGVGSVTAIPNAVRVPDPGVAPAAPHDLLFVATLSYPPNVEAACWLCREVAPRIDGATVALVGSGPAPAVRALARDGVTVAADVPDVAPWYAGARVAVAPLRAGGGTRIKVLEAFAHRRPVVATTGGAEGLDLAGPGGPVVIADSPAAFASACGRLLDDPAEAARLAARGEAMVRASSTVDHVAASIQRLFRTILAAA